MNKSSAKHTRCSKRRTARFNRNERKIEQSIFELLPDHRGKITMGQVARRAKLSRITVYNHYHNINHAITEIEERLLLEFRAVLDGKKVHLLIIISPAIIAGYFLRSCGLWQAKRNYSILYAATQMLMGSCSVLWRYSIQS